MIKFLSRLCKSACKVALLGLLACSPVFAQGGQTTSMRHGSSLPATCKVSNGDQFYLTTGTVGPYFCGPTDNNWTFGTSLFTSFKVDSNAAMTAAGTYFQLNHGTNVTISWSGSGTSGSPYVATINATSGSTVCGTTGQLLYNNAGSCGGFGTTISGSDITFPGQITATKLVLTINNNWTLGDETANPGWVWVKSDGGTHPGYFKGSGVNGSFFSYFFACQQAGFWCMSPGIPAADSDATIAVHGGVVSMTVQNGALSQSNLDQTINSSNTFAAMTTTAASITGTSNTVVLTFATDPTVDFVVGGTVTVSGFTGSDTFFNGTFTVSATSSISKTISYALTHAAATATTTGSVIGTLGLPCPSGTNLRNGWVTILSNIAASGTATVTTSGCNINGGTTLSVSEQTAQRITSDGTNLWAQPFGGGGGSSGVSSFNTRTGAVTPATGDYTAAQVTNAFDMSATRAADTVLAGPSGYKATAAAPTIRALTPDDDLDASSWLDVKDEFCAGLTSTGSIGNLSWGMNGGTTVATAGTANHPCVIQRSTGTTISTDANLFLGTSTFSNLPLISINASKWHVTWIVGQDASSTNPTTQEIIRCGLFNNAVSDPPSDGYYFENVTTTSAANWAFVTRATSTSTSTASSVALDTSFHRFDIVSDGAGNVSGYIDGTLISTSTTNLSAAAMQPVCYVKNTEATAKLLDIDFFKLGLAVTR